MFVWDGGWGKEVEVIKKLFIVLYIYNYFRDIEGKW